MPVTMRVTTERGVVDVREPWGARRRIEQRAALTGGDGPGGPRSARDNALGEKKGGGHRALPLRVDVTPAAYCMPPRVLLYEKVLPEPLVELDVPVNDGLAPAAPVIAIVTVSESWKPGRLVSQAPLAQVT